MFVATNQLKIQTGHGSELEDRFRTRGGVERQLGFLGFELWKLNQAAEDEVYLVVAHWESEDAHHKWTRSEAFQRAHAGPHPEYILGPGQFNSYNGRINYGPEGEKG